MLLYQNTKTAITHSRMAHSFEFEIPKKTKELQSVIIPQTNTKQATNAKNNAISRKNNEWVTQTLAVSLNLRNGKLMEAQQICQNYKLNPHLYHQLVDIITNQYYIDIGKT